MNKPLFLLLLSAFFIPTASAQSTDHFIERIRVHGARRTGSRLIIAESRIKTGSSYSEKVLTEAVRRINRLPFVFNTDFSLEKGHEKGKYTLVIEVTETRAFRYGLSSTHFDNPDELGESNGDLILTGRWFPGTGGSLYLGWEEEQHWSNDVEDGGNFAIGYSHHDLFRAGVFLDIRLSSSGATYNDDDDNDDWATHGSSQSITLAVPVQQNQRIRGIWKEFRSNKDPYFAYREVFSEDYLPNYFFRSSDVTSTTLAWVYDTRNDNVVSSAGRHGRIGYRRTEERERYRYIFPELPGNDGLGYETDQLFADFRQYSEVDDNHSFSYGVHATYVDSDGPYASSINQIDIIPRSFETRRGGLDLGYTWDILGRSSNHRGKFRFELLGSVDKMEREGAHTGSFDIYRAGASLSYHKRRYTFRLSYNYYDVNE